MAQIKKYIVVKLQVEGFHRWPQAKEILPEMGFLSDRHRHIFHFTCKKEVSHSDRDIEIIKFKREILSHLYSKYGTYKEIPNITNHWTSSYCEFENLSCEMLAEELINKFDLESCEVLEDGENGSICVNENMFVPNNIIGSRMHLGE